MELIVLKAPCQIEIEGRIKLSFIHNVIYFNVISDINHQTSYISRMTQYNECKNMQCSRSYIFEGRVKTAFKMLSYPFLLHISYFIIFFHKHEVDNRQMLVSQPVFITCSPASSHCFEVLIFQGSKIFVVLPGNGLVWDLSLFLFLYPSFYFFSDLYLISANPYSH